MIKRFLVVDIASVLLLLVLFFLTKPQPELPANGITHGTVVLVSVDPDSIVMAADSREVNISFSRKKISYTDVSEKIFRINSTFFAIAGLSELGGTSTRAFVTKIYDTTRSIKENVPVVEAKLKNALQFELNSYNRTQKKWLAGRDYNVVLYIAGYENGRPVLCRINAGATFLNLFSNPVKSSNRITSVAPTYDFAGITDHMSINFFRSANKLHDMISQISTEAKYHIEVDSVVHYAVIKKGGYRMGDNQ